MVERGVFCREWITSLLRVNFSSDQSLKKLHGRAGQNVVRDSKGGRLLTKAVARQRSYHDVLTLEKFRAQLLPEMWGPVPVLINELVRGTQIFERANLNFWNTKEAVKPNRHLIGLMLAHNGRCWSFGPAEYMRPWDCLVAVMQQHGFYSEGSRFYPYWEKLPAIEFRSCRSKRVCVSVYEASKELALVVFNDSNENVTGQLWLGPEKYPCDQEEKLFFDDAFSDAQYALKDQTINLEVPARDFRLLIRRAH
ncbi:MAG: hypothetical protein PHV34_03715 [Verrucomicrobiae bacterium]|nr:hypothetical protein [Verrucomicrobiae bacterium]